MIKKIILIFVLFTISLFGQFKANKDGFSMKMESEEDKNVICDFVLYYNKNEYFDMFISIGVNLDETNKPTRISFSTFNGRALIPYEDNLNKGIGILYSEKDKQHKIIFTQDAIMTEILEMSASEVSGFIQIYTKDTFYNFDLLKYNDKMKKNKKFKDAIMRLIYNPK